jgi:protoporphyrinogen/coproporphyrinogen III oxidase
MPRIAIIGGGLSGVSTAYELTRRGCTDFVLYESSGRLGGIVETHREDGFIIECGADSWVTEKPWARDLAIELGLEDQLIPSNDAHRRTYLVESGKLVPMPDGMRMMVPADLKTIATSPLFSEAARRAYREEPSRAEELKRFAATRSDGWDESIADFVNRHFGVEVAEKVAAPLLAGVFGGDIRQLSVSATMAPFVKMERDHGSLLLAVQRQPRLNAPPPAVFTSLKSGLQTLIERMAAVIPQPAIRLNEAVIGVTPSNGKWEIATADASTLGASNVAAATIFAHVVVATPVHVARKLVAPWSQELQALLEIEATSAVIAALAFDRSQSAQLTIPEGFGFLAPQRNGADPAGPQLLACTFVNQKFSYRAPQGCVVLRAFYGGSSAPALLTQSDSLILDLARRQLSSLFGEISEPKLQLVRRWPRSLPQYTLGHPARVSRVEALVAKIPGLHLVGNAYHGVGLPDMVRKGRAIASALMHA